MMIKTFTSAALQTPWWVYLLLAYFIIIGVKASKTRIISVKRLSILPIIFITMSVHTLLASFQLNAFIIFIWITSVSIGCLVGWMLVRRQNILVDRDNFLIQLPGSWLTLILVLIIFSSKYYFGYELAVDPAMIKQTVFEFSMLFISGACTGLIIGRVGFYMYQLYKLESINLFDQSNIT